MSGPLNQLYREAVPRMIEVKFSANGKFAPGNVPPVNPAHKGRPQESEPSVHRSRELKVRGPPTIVFSELSSNQREVVPMPMN